MRKLYHILCKAEVIACGIGFMFLISFVFFAAVIRFFDISFSWSIDLAMLLLAWTAFLGADIAWRQGQIIGVDLLTKRLPPMLRNIVELVILTVIMVALVIMFYSGLQLAWIERLRTYQSMPLPYSLVIFSIVVASLSMVLSTILKIRRVILRMINRSPADEGTAA